MWIQKAICPKIGEKHNGKDDIELPTFGTAKTQPMPDLTLSNIFIYPIKSLGGISVEKASVRKKGLELDRRWMLIDRNGVAMTQRLYPHMALFKVSIAGGELQVAFRRSGSTIDSTHFPVFAAGGDKLTAQVWEDSVDVTEVDAEVSHWFCDYLLTPCKLVTFPEKNPRPVNPRHRIGNDHVSLADAYPFMIIGQRSLDDLNQKLSEPVPMNRFRPNFVFTGGTAFDEDSWKDLAIGNINFAAVKKCARCALPTVDQETAIKSLEPIRTLSTYRKIDNAVYFGQNLIALDEGIVAVGDRIITR